MRARDVMTANVISVSPSSSVRSVARTMLLNRISAVPVIDDEQKLVGIVSDDDLLQRLETGARRAWWRGLLDCPESQALEYVKSHGQQAQDVMTPAVVTVDEDTSASKIAEIFYRERIKRVPVMRGTRLVGVVSRADLLRAIVTAPADQTAQGDDAIRLAVVTRLQEDAGLSGRALQVTVLNGIVYLRGSVPSQQAKRAAHVAVWTVRGVQGVVDRLKLTEGRN